MKKFLIVLMSFAIFSMLNVQAQDSGNGRATAIFAGGCFWCMEPPYDKLAGVTATVSGYSGGELENPTYEQVSAGGTGHAEAVQISYDPGKVSYEKLLDVFWHNIDPLDAGGQFCDRGDSYRSAIFYQNDKEKRLAQASKRALQILPLLLRPRWAAGGALGGAGLGRKSDCAFAAGFLSFNDSAIAVLVEAALAVTAALASSP